MFFPRSFPELKKCRQYIQKFFYVLVLTYCKAALSNLMAVANFLALFFADLDGVAQIQ